MRDLTLNAPFTSTGVGGETYRVDLLPYAGVHTGHRCFIFSGQSVIFPGMFARELREIDQFATRFANAEALLPGCSKFISAPAELSPAEQIRARNPALFTAQVALFDHLSERGVTPKLITAHSFGEYAGLVTAGLATFEEMFEIIVERDRLSPPAHALGMMIVVGAPAEQVKALLHAGTYHIACYNSPKQTVIAVPPDAVESTTRRLKSAKVAAFKIPQVPQPYHTPWLAPTADKLKKFIQARGVKFTPARYAFMSSVNGQVIEVGEGPELEPAKILSAQMTAPMNFIAQVHGVEARGICHFMEFGPSGSCAQFVRDTINHPVLKISSPNRYLESGVKESKRSALHADKGKFSGLLNTIISSITGYNIEEISLQDKFQEDLGIDSIKKAEIVFKLTEAVAGSGELILGESLNLSKINQIGDVLELLTLAQYAKKEQFTPKITDFGTYDEHWVPAKIAPLDLVLKPQPPPPRFFDLERPASWDIEAMGLRENLVFFARRLAGGGDDAFKLDPTGQIRRVLLPLVEKLRQISAENEKFVTYRISLVLEDGCDPVLKCLDGFFMSWVREMAFAELKILSCRDLPAWAELAEMVAREWAVASEYSVRYEKGERFVRRVRPLEISAPFAIENPVFVSIGGMRGIGTAVLKSAMAQFPKGHYYILGRKREDDPAVRETLSEFKTLSPNVRYLVADAADKNSLEQALSLIHERHEAIDVLLNGAGAQFSRSFKSKTDDEIILEFQSKVLPAAHLLDHCDRHAVRRLIHYVSVSGKFGNRGQTAYAFANRAIEELSLARPGVTILALPAWDNLGMTEDKLALTQLRAQQFSLLPPKTGGELVVRVACAETPPSYVTFLDHNDIYSAESGNYGREIATQMFGEPVILFTRMPVQHINTVNFPSVVEHRVKGNVVYPASSAIALLFGAARQVMRENLELRDFRAHQPLAVGDGPSRHQLALDWKNKILKMELGAELVHFSAEARASREALECAWPAPRLKRLVNQKLLNQPDRIELGPKFCRQSTWIGDDGEFAGILPVANLSADEPTPGLSHVQQIVEAALQILGVKLIHEQKSYWAPCAIGSLKFRLGSGLGENLQLRARVSRVDGDRAYGDCFVLNEAGDVLMEFRDVENFRVGDSQNGVDFVDEA